MAYVDDIRMFLKAFAEGTMFCCKCKSFWHSKDQEEEDRSSGVSDTVRTANILKSLFNSIEKDLEFTVETSEDFNSDTLPTLDTQIWMETQKWGGGH